MNNGKQVFLRRSLSAALLAWMVLPGAGSVFGQRLRVKLDNIRFYDRKTPNYQDHSAPQATSKYSWLQIMVEYTAEGGRDGWIDEVSLEWHVLVQGRRTLLLHKTVSYVDVESGKHRAVVYIRPAIIRRYGKNRRISKRDVHVYVLARVNGVGSSYATYPRERIRSKWWEAKPPRVMLRPGELKSRDETPFAPLDYDYYEQLKPRTTGPQGP